MNDDMLNFRPSHSTGKTDFLNNKTTQSQNSTQLMCAEIVRQVGQEGGPKNGTI